MISFAYPNILPSFTTCDIGSKAKVKPTPFFYEIKISDSLP
jgi:hypothetical protein